VRYRYDGNEHGFGAYATSVIVDAYSAADAVTQVSVQLVDRYRVTNVEPIDAPLIEGARERHDA
jgi:hypothetical protein